MLPFLNARRTYISVRSKRSILVGDPQQLPATVISGKAKDFNYQCSLFQRLQEHYPVVLLDTQYRMVCRDYYFLFAFRCPVALFFF